MTGLRILLIDDDRNVREVLALMLTTLGHRVQQAAGGRDGLTLLEGGAQVDLVLTDLHMPDVDGRCVAKEVKRRWPALRVGLLSGTPGESDERETGADFVLTKPVTLAVLREALDRASILRLPTAGAPDEGPQASSRISRGAWPVPGRG